MRCGVSLFADRRSCTQIKPYNRAHGIQLRNIMGDQEHCPSSAAPACVRHHGFFGLPVQTLERLKMCIRDSSMDSISMRIP